MPEYLAPGVYVEEVSFRSKSIEGVSTTTTGFIGPARYGPVNLEPDVITSLGEYERVYGDGQQLRFSDQPKALHNYLWHAVRAFFEEGGKRLYVVRTFRESEVPSSEVNTFEGRLRQVTGSDGVTRHFDLGVGYRRLPSVATDDNAIHVQARFPGRLGNMRVALSLNIGQNVFSGDASNLANVERSVGSLQDNDIVWIRDQGSPIASPVGGSPGGEGRFYQARTQFDEAAQENVWSFYNAGNQRAFGLADLFPHENPAFSDEIRVVTLTVTVLPSDPFDLPREWPDIPLDPGHRQVGSGAPDSLVDLFAPRPANRAQEYSLPLVVTLGSQLTNGLQVLEALIAGAPDPAALGVNLRQVDSSPASRSFEIVLVGGNDGARPSAAEYEGSDDPNANYKTGLKSFEDIEDISIVAGPGSTFGLENGYRADANTIVNLLISHATRMRYRIAVLDSGDEQTIAQVRAMRARLDSKYAALYYPWVRVLDPISRREIDLPPSGFVAGIYARNDINRAVYKAPANEVVNLALGFEQMLNKSQQDVLNPEGINCFRFFEGRGFRLWGARTISSDPEWKYVNLRRYFAYVERSIDKGTQWAVFEPNGEALWANVRRTIEDFLLNEWMSGALLGDKPEKAYFVRCDRSTMTQNDLDNGRLVCLIGIAPLRPAEFVIFRIGQWTADRRV
jgi:phage tail sheath protein FI